MDDVKRCFYSAAVDCPRKAVSHILREERRNCEGGTKQRKIRGRINPLCGEHCVSSGMRGGQHTLRKGGRSGERSNIAREGCREERESAKARGMGVPGCSGGGGGGAGEGSIPAHTPHQCDTQAQRASAARCVRRRSRAPRLHPGSSIVIAGGRRHCVCVLLSLSLSNSWPAIPRCSFSRAPDRGGGRIGAPFSEEGLERQ